ncbi:MAG TPA: hypothetical protein VFR35_20605 [Actinoplanes sp.]|nr:hypothetical protein [Actinoplanes sp.]
MRPHRAGGMTAARRDAAAADGYRDGLLWLALPPLWTGHAALDVGFPVDDLTGFLKWAVANGYAERRGGAMPERLHRTTFWILPDARNDELKRAVQRLGRDETRAVAVRVATALSRFGQLHSLPRVVRLWIGLVYPDGGDQERDFLGRVRNLCRAGRRDQAADLVRAADVLLPIASPTLADAVERAHRQLLMANRRSHDLESMQSFQARPEWSAALDHLLGDRDADRWALHLVGLGGTGKTMFIRYVASGQYAEDTGRAPMPVARVDFDHLSPDYPVRRPVQLLVELADELAPYIESGDGDRALETFFSIAKSAHAAGAGRTPDRAADLVDEAVQAFSRFVGTLAQPVLLILDTCEELSRLSPAGVPNRAVDRTFELLNQIRFWLPGLRVLLSARRPLSRLPGRDAAVTRELPVRPQVRVLEARGFRLGEATEFLLRPYRKRTMSPELVEVVLEQSPEPGRVLVPADPVDTADDRFSPYDLAMYRRWWASDTTISAAELRHAGRYAYVEVRILPRLKRSLIRSIPAVALLGRFDRHMLAPALPGGHDAEAIIRELMQLEWTDVDTDPASRAPIVEVEAPIQRLLRAWAHHKHPAWLREARQRLAGALGAELVSRPLEKISTAHVVSALRLAQPEEAVDLWTRLERRSGVDDGWAWMATVCARVLGAVAETETEPVVPAEAGGPDGLAGNNLLSAAVRTTMVALARRDAPGADMAGAWDQVEAAIGPDDTAVARYLRLRARLGRAASKAARSRLSEEEMAAVAGDLEAAAHTGPGLTGSAVATIEAILENQPAGGLEPVLRAAQVWAEATGDGVVRAFLKVGIRRIKRATRPPAGGLLLPADGTSPGSVAAEAERARPEDGRWTDWPAPPDCVLWAHLHHAVEALMCGRPLRALPMREWERRAEAGLFTIDGERLMSQCLQLRLSHGAVTRDRLDRLRALDLYDPRRIASRSVHRSVPPLFVSLSDGYLALGDAGMALAVLRDRRGDATSDRQEDVTVREANRAIVRLTRRLRDDRIALTTRSRADRDDARFRGAVWAANVLVDGRAPVAHDWGDGTDLRRWHDCWQAQPADARTGKVAIPVAPDLGPARGNLVPLLIADADEVARAGDGPARADIIEWRRRTAAGEIVIDIYEEDAPPAAVRLWLARADRDELLGPRSANLPTHGPLLEASVALELGELRALRDPAGALPLLDFAFEQSRSRSPVIAVQAATLRALAVLHHREPPDDPSPTALALELSRAYDRFREVVGTAAAPPWPEVVDAAEDLGGPWQGWLRRIRVAARGLIPAASEAVPGPAVAEAAPETAGDRPVELRGGGFGAAPAAGTPPPGEPTSGNGGPVSESPMSRSSTIVARLADSPLAVSVTRRFAGRPRVTVTVDRRRGHLEVTKDYLPPAGPATAGSRLRRTALRFLWSPVRWRAAFDPSVDVPDIPVPRFAEQDAPYVIGRLRLPLSDQALPWEERLISPAGRPVIWYREWHARRAPDIPVIGRGLTVVAPQRCAGLVEEIYQTRHRLTTHFYLDGGPGADGRTGWAPAALLHVVGRPVADSNGTLLQVSERRHRRGPAEESFVNPEDVAGHRAALTVIQGLPHSGQLRIDPFEAAVARQFAADTMVAGAAAVLLLPALPGAAAQRVFALLAGAWAQRWRPSPEDMVQLAYDIRAEIIVVASEVEHHVADEDLRDVLGQVLLWLPHRSDPGGGGPRI